MGLDTDMGLDENPAGEEPAPEEAFIRKYFTCNLPQGGEIFCFLFF
jgi:hypothetical protein